MTELSGRGVGLDVVLKSIERLNGLVEVETVPGVGTKFIIQLPLTLAIISALLVEVAGRTYAVPAGLGGGEPEVRRRRRSTRINGRETLRIRDRIVPLLRLATLFGLPERGRAADRAVRGDPRPRRQAGGPGGGPAARPAGGRDQGPRPRGLRRAPPGMAGATIMGDGRVVLILDVAALFEGRRHSVRPAAGCGAAGRARLAMYESLLRARARSRSGRRPTRATST